MRLSLAPASGMRLSGHGQRVRRQVVLLQPIRATHRLATHLEPETYTKSQLDERSKVTNLQSWLQFTSHAHKELTITAAVRKELQALPEAQKQERDKMGLLLQRILEQWLAEVRSKLQMQAAAELTVWAQSSPRNKSQNTQLLLYYAVCTSNSKLVDCLLDEMGHSWEAHPPGLTAGQATPVLALAVVQRDHEMVQQLLSRGADPYTIPPAFYLPAMREEGMHGLPLDSEGSAHGSAADWCANSDSGDRVRLQEALSTADDCGFTMAYWLARATKLPPLTSLTHKVMAANTLHRVPPLRMAVIGQEVACCLLWNQVMVYMGMSGHPQDSKSHKPLVLLLAGPPGHGKTLIGKKLQDMLGIDYHFEDFSKLHHIVDLLGASGPFKKSEKQPPFAAFLRANSGKRSVVIMDEFEKTRTEVQDSLLGVLQNGWYTDPYSGERVDCSKTIFIMTTNAADDDIYDHWQKHKGSILEAELKPSVLQRRLKPLDRLIRAAVAARTSRSLTSRVTGVIPFFPFTEFESMALVQQELLNMKKHLQEPVDEKSGRQYGSITVKLQDQPQVLRKLAKEHYNEAEGARAVVNGIGSTVRSETMSTLLEERLAAVGGRVKVMAAKDPADPYDIEFDG